MWGRFTKSGLQLEAMFQLVLILGLCSLSICLARQYHFVNESKTWAEAQRYCREHYVDLASIDNTEDTRELMNVVDIRSRSLAWIGLYDDLNSWRWSLDDDNFYKGNERNFRNWYIQKPENWGGNSLCLYIFSYDASWWPAPCSSTLQFICYDGRANASTRYVFVYEYMNWTDAQSYCREYYTDLAIVRNDTENQKLTSLVDNDGYWKAGQPDNAEQSEYCTAVSFNDSGQWTDENCTHTLPFLCFSAESPTFSHQYHFVNESRSWTEAQRYCRENYTDLATIDNMEEMISLINTVNSSYSGLAWIGLYDDLDSWRWSLDDESFYKEEERDFRGWDRQPDFLHGEELCVNMHSDGRWFDQNCLWHLPFVCYDDQNETDPYIWIREYRTWADAQSYCRQLYTDLASVRNLTENQRILNITGGSGAWIGLYRTRLWSDQHSSTYENWRSYIEYSPEQPDNGAYKYFFKESGYQHCTAVSFSDSGLWTDEDCSATFPFICYSRFCSSSLCVHQYHFVNESKSWTEAQRYCREHYTDLATIDNMEEMNRLINTVNSSYSGLAWIGLYDDLDSWRWSLDDESLYKENETNFRNWYIQKPVNFRGNSMCGSYSYSSWLESICSYGHRFICYDGRANASSRYVLVEQLMNWTDAQRYCREHYTDLASVRNETENRKLKALVRTDDYSAWIGLYRTRSWSDQSNSSFSYWKAGQPDNAGQSEYCTAVSFNDSGQWKDENCSRVFPFLCYSAMPSHQYHFVNESKSWTEAQRYCRENYTDLATIDNMEEMNRLINTVNNSYSGLAWIGLYDDLDSWRWSLDDDSFYKEGERDFRGWAREPDNYYGKELCVYMSSTGEWFDTSCVRRWGFVCYNSANNTYVWIFDGKSWTEAQSFCRQYYTDLASVRNQTELQQILRVSKGYRVWIGLYRNRLWSDQSNSTFTYWRPGNQSRSPEPNNGLSVPGEYGNQHCIAVDHSGYWTDEDCLATFPFVCYSDNVVGLRVKVKDEKNLSASQIEGLVLMQ
ncbi:hypothetical protein NFI96_005746, partial [Prochilodus magdalenae]